MLRRVLRRAVRYGREVLGECSTLLLLRHFDGGWPSAASAVCISCEVLRTSQPACPQPPHLSATARLPTCPSQAPRRASSLPW